MKGESSFISNYRRTKNNKHNAYFVTMKSGDGERDLFIRYGYSGSVRVYKADSRVNHECKNFITTKHDHVVMIPTTVQSVGFKGTK